MLTYKLDAGGNVPLYRQLYMKISADILSGTLPRGARLPSKRLLADHLGVSRNTVETAYGLLLAEGYISSRARSGYFVQPTESLELPEPFGGPGGPERVTEPPETVSALHPWLFSTGDVDTEVFPYATWARISREVLHGHPELLRRGDPRGDIELREALCIFLREYRGVVCSPEQVIIGAGHQFLLDLLVQLLPEDAVYAMENPGYPASYRVFLNNRRRTVLIGLDEEGMKVPELVSSGADIAYVTPSHQFPMGITMPVGRRSSLLKWASDAPGRFLVEDDYDSEFRYNSRPIPAMQSLDRAGRVIYTGTFSRSLAPSFRIAYLILPEGLLSVYRERFGESASSVSRFEQQVLARFIREGYYGRHLRRAGHRYLNRRNALLSALSVLPKARILGSEAGLHFTLLLENENSEPELLGRLEREGLRIHGLGEYVHDDSPHPAGLVLGYAGMTEEHIRTAAAELTRVIG